MGMRLRDWLVVGMLIASTSFAFPQGDPNPDAVVRNFISRAGALDLKGMMGCFAIDEYSRNYDVVSVATELGWVNFGAQLLPNKYPIFQEINGHRRIEIVVDQIEVFLFALTIGVDGFNQKKVAGPEDVATMVSKMDPAPIRNIELLYIRNPVPSKVNDRALKLYVEQAKREGAIDSTERVALVDIAGTTYVVPFRLLKYDSNWLIEALYSNYANIFRAARLSRDEFLNLYPGQ
jgi:hypothetical protein